MFYAISYDISDDHRRNNISKLLEAYGVRVQFSVFECNLNQEKFDELWQRLVEFIKPGEDSLRCYPLCNICLSGVNLLGGPPVSLDSGFYIA